jgi:hypothetical protein
MPREHERIVATLLMADILEPSRGRTFGIDRGSVGIGYRRSPPPDTVTFPRSTTPNAA